MGSYDGVLIIKADTPEKAMHWLTELASYGNVTTETLAAFDVQQFQEILELS